MAEDTGQGTSCLVLSQYSLGRKTYSSYALTQLWPGSVVPHETGAGGWHFTIVSPSAKTQKREQLAFGVLS